MSRIQPYSPMHEPQKHVSADRMAEILAKNARPKVEIVVARKEPLTWQDPVKTGPHGTGYMLSVCGRFSIEKSTHELGYTYCAWDLSTKTDKAQAMNLGCRRTKDEAIALCEAVR